jgi:3-dehydroquinate dehydratase type I
MDQISSKKPDLVEFRLDELGDQSILGSIAKKKSFPAIATDKSGRASSSRILDQAVAEGFEYVDTELSSDHFCDNVKQLKSRGAQVIVSHHDYAGTPSVDELRKILRLQRESGADICKIVTTANHPRDNIVLLDLLDKEAHKGPMVAFAMGTAGIASRILSPLFGAEFTFASITEESKTAAGQLSIDNLRSAWRTLGIQ